MNIGGIDLSIVLIYLAAITALGVWLGRNSRGASDYMVGGRDLPWWLILFSIVATETSTITFLSIPGFAYSRDISWLQIPVGFLIGRLVASYLLLPRYFGGGFYTAYEVLQQRFGGATQQTAAAMFIVTRSLADGLRLFLSAIVLQEMTGVPMAWAVVALGLTTIVYTYFGGIRAVVWTDLIQFVLYITGGLVAFALIAERLPGGWRQIQQLGAEAGKLDMWRLTTDLSEPYGLWAGLIGGIFIALGSHGVDQLMVQRYLCARRLKDAQRALSLSGFVVFLQFALFLGLGVALFAFYQAYPPEVPFDRPDRVFARFILDEMPVGLLGLLLGGTFAAAMSTLSSSLNSCATTAVKDLWPSSNSAADPDERKLLLRTRLLTAFFGLVQIAVGIGGTWLNASVVNSVLGISAFTTGIVLGVFFLGIFTTTVDQRAALVGLVFGLVAMTVIFFATPLAWPWYALVGSTLTFSAGWLANRVLQR